VQGPGFQEHTHAHTQNPRRKNLEILEEGILVVTQQELLEDKDSSFPSLEAQVMRRVTCQNSELGKGFQE
jgi:hypothetical protein